MLLPVYENKELVQIHFQNSNTINYSLNNQAARFSIDFKTINSNKKKITDIPYFQKFAMLSIINFEHTIFYVYCIRGEVFITKKLTVSAGDGLKVNIEILNDRFSVDESGNTILIRDNLSDWTYEINEKTFNNRGIVFEPNLHEDADLPDGNGAIVYFRIQIENFYVFCEIYRKSKKFALKYLTLDIISDTLPQV